MVDCMGYGSNQVRDRTCLLSGGDSEALKSSPKVFAVIYRFREDRLNKCFNLDYEDIQVAATPNYFSTHDMEQRKRLLGILYINFNVRTVILRIKEVSCHYNYKSK
jgi:hypothetical protein